MSCAGYGRACGSIGLAPGLAAIFRAANYFGSEAAGLTWERLDDEARQRSLELSGEVSISHLGHVDPL